MNSFVAGVKNRHTQETYLWLVLSYVSTMRHGLRCCVASTAYWIKLPLGFLKRLYLWMTAAVWVRRRKKEKSIYARQIITDAFIVTIIT